VNQPVALGFAAGATDAGHEGASGSFALDNSGRLDWQSIRNFAHVGIHEMTVTGKALTEAMYGVAPRFSYFNGCSTGGRQGLMEAQRYPQDYNGILSGAPALNWNRFHIQHLWGPVVMNASNNPVAGCKLSAATAAAIAACDNIDGVKDGVIEDPKRCSYDPKALVGTSAGECGAFTDADVNMIRKLWEGPQQQMGGAKKTSEFIRLFMAPGVGHCGGGVGPAPVGQLEALLAGVENGKAPETLTATRRDQSGTVTRSRPWCAYPLSQNTRAAAAPTMPPISAAVARSKACR
jgi:tannase/feruloyl esterase